MRKSFEIQIPRSFAQIALWFTSFLSERHLVLVCKGYDGDYEFYTGLDWDEDKDLDFRRDESYEDFRLWFNL